MKRESPASWRAVQRIDGDQVASVVAVRDDFGDDWRPEEVQEVESSEQEAVRNDEPDHRKERNESRAAQPPCRSRCARSRDRPAIGRAIGLGRNPAGITRSAYDPKAGHEHGDAVPDQTDADRDPGPNVAVDWLERSANDAHARDGE